MGGGGLKNAQGENLLHTPGGLGAGRWRAPVAPAYHPGRLDLKAPAEQARRGGGEDTAHHHPQPAAAQQHTTTNQTTEGARKRREASHE